jgi:hypothetical protein
VALELQRPGMGSSLLFLMGADAQTGFLFFFKNSEPSRSLKNQIPIQQWSVCVQRYIYIGRKLE